VEVHEDHVGAGDDALRGDVEDVEQAVGRLLGLSAVSPHLGTVIEDLLSSNEGLEVGERQVTAEEVGKAPDSVDDLVAQLNDPGFEFTAQPRRIAFFAAPMRFGATARAGEHSCPSH
jgi:hypothetical protein